MSIKIINKRNIYCLLLYCAFSCFLFSEAVEGIEPTSSLIELEGQINPTFTLSLIYQGRQFQNNQSSSVNISLNQVDSFGLNPNRIGRLVRSSERFESYYQTDVIVRVQISGTNASTNLLVNQTDSGPLRGLIYEAAQDVDLNQTSKLQAIPIAPQRQIAISNIKNGIHDYQRQIILRIPPALPQGPQNAIIQYGLEVTP